VEKFEGRNKSSASGIFSALESFVSQSIKILTNRKNQTSKVPTEILVQFEQYYKDGAVVTTPFGQGTVESFRKSDGVYVVALLD